MKRKVFYPPIGIAHATNEITDLIEYKFKNQKKIIINTSAQPNSSPHLGTITTIMCAFALARKIKNKFNVATEVQFDELENSPSEIMEIENDIYYKDQKHSFIDGNTKENVNMKNFYEILENISLLSNVPFSVRTYVEFQQDKYVRQTIVDIINKKKYFKNLLFPSSADLHIRTICPICGLGKKNIEKLEEKHSDYEVEFIGKCPIHGEYVIKVNKNNKDYIDINTQLRDLTKGVAMLKNDENLNTLTIMLDGGDWSGVWAQRMHTEGLVKLGFKNFPIRFFAPVILDWSGAKFSKSLYLEDNAYKDINKAFINYNNFIDFYGKKGIKILWKEVASWLDEPKKFFRNYSVDYFQEVMEEEKYG